MKSWNPEEQVAATGYRLNDGCRVAVMGGGVAGSMFSFFFLTLADRIGLQVEVDLFEPKDFCNRGAAGCNMCGGIISESLVHMLAAEGINLPSNVVQRGVAGSLTVQASRSHPRRSPALRRCA